MIEIDKLIKKLLFTRAEQQAFLEDVSALVKDGVPAPQAVNTIYEIANGSTKEVARTVLQSISEGQSIADGMEGWFSQSIIEVVRAGEEGGALTDTMEAASQSLESRSSAFTSLLTSITYPFVVLIMGMIVSVFLKHSVFVNFAAIKPIATWPPIGRTLLGIASFIEGWWWLVFLILFGAGIFLVRTLTELTGEIRRGLDAIPPFSLYRGYSAGRFMQTLGLLIDNGIGFKQALFILQRKASHYMSWHIQMMQLRLSAGQENIADVLDTGMVKEDDVLRLRAMGKGKGFERALLHLGEQALTRNAKHIRAVGRITGVFLLFIDASFAIFMIFAIYNVGTFVGS